MKRSEMVKALSDFMMAENEVTHTPLCAAEKVLAMLEQTMLPPQFHIEGSGTYVEVETVVKFASLDGKFEWEPEDL